MILLSRPVFSSWNIFNSNSFPNFKILHVTNPPSKDEWSRNPLNRTNKATEAIRDNAKKGSDKVVESMTNFDATLKTIKEFSRQPQQI